MIQVTKKAAAKALKAARKRVAKKAGRAPAAADVLASREVLVPVFLRISVPAEVADDLDAAQAAVEWVMESGVKVDGVPVPFDLITPQVK